MVEMKTTKKATRDMVRAIPEPEWTDTWHPIGHGAVMDALNDAIKKTGMTVIRDNYTMVNEGQRVFGEWVLDRRVNGINCSIGWRNSMDKSMAIGICAGTHVIVCSNMQFSAEWIEFRMHTGNLDRDELFGIAAKAVDSVIVKSDELAEWHRSLKSIELPQFSERWKSAVFDLMESGVVPSSRFKKFLDLYDVESSRNNFELKNSVYVLHAAATNVLKNDNMFTVAKRTSELTEIINRVSVAA